jgi:DNA-binding LacI/PurR family transcriptional regulator
MIPTMRRSADSAATILDVARVARVSRTTVSRVLNEPDRVTEATLARVRHAMDELRYVPNTAARGLRAGRTGLIALLVGDIAQPFHGTLAKAVASAAEQNGLGVVLYDLGHSTARLEDVLRKLPQQGVDGIIIATADDVSTPTVRAALDDCLHHGIVVVASLEYFGDGQVTTIDIDYTIGAKLAGDALRDAGFTAPALMVGDAASPIARLLAIGARPTQVIDAAYSFDAAEEAVHTLAPDIDSLIVATLPMALGAVAGLAAVGRILPLVVCEATSLTRQVRPSFSTAAVPPEDIGEEMVRLVDAAIRGVPVERHTLVARLQRRDTF